MLAYPVSQLPPIAPLDPEPSQFFPGAAEPCAKDAGASSVILILTSTTMQSHMSLTIFS